MGDACRFVRVPTFFVALKGKAKRNTGPCWGRLLKKDTPKSRLKNRNRPKWKSGKWKVEATLRSPGC